MFEKIENFLKNLLTKNKNECKISSIKNEQDFAERNFENGGNYYEHI